jgi:hypothetical protein
MEAGKFQIPNYKFQINPKSQSPMTKEFGLKFCIWNIEIYLLFGACDLVLDDSLQGAAI